MASSNQYKVLRQLETPEGQKIRILYRPCADHQWEQLVERLVPGRVEGEHIWKHWDINWGQVTSMLLDIVIKDDEEREREKLRRPVLKRQEDWTAGDSNGGS